MVTGIRRTTDENVDINSRIKKEGSRGANKDLSPELLNLLSRGLGDIDLESGQAKETETVQRDISEENIEVALASISALIVEIQEWQADFQSSKSSVESKISKALIDSSIDAMKDTVKKWHDYHKKQHKHGLFGKIMKAIEVVAAVVVTLIPGCEAIGMAMMVMMVVDQAGGTKALADALKKAGCGSVVANLIASAAIGIACGGVTAIASVGIAAATSTAESVAEAAVKTAVKQTIREVVADAIKSSVKSAAEQGVEMTSEAAAEQGVEAGARAAQDLAETWGSDLVNSVMEDAFSQGIKQGLKDAGLKSLSKSVLQALAKQGAEFAKTAIGDVEGTAGTELTSETINEDVQGQVKDLVQKFEQRLTKRIFKLAVKTTVAQTVNEMTSTGLVNDLTVWVVKEAGGSEKLQKSLALVMNLIVMLVSMLAMGLSGGEGESGSSTSLISKLSGGFIKNPASFLAKTQGFISAAEVGVGLADLDNTIELYKVEKETGKSQAANSLFNALTNIQNQIMGNSVKKFNEMQRQIPTMMQDVNAMIRQMASEAQALAQ